MVVQSENFDEDKLAAVFAALADPTRLRILGRIAERTMTGRELSESLALTPPTISHHMAKLVHASLVTVTADGNRRHYALSQSMLASAGRKAAANWQPGEPPAVEQTGDPVAMERAKVLRDFFDGERLKQIPAQRKKRVFVLQRLLERFSPDRDYTEKDVNDILRPVHDDVATLRRELIDYGYMTRARGIYRVSHAPPSRGATVAQEIPDDERSWLQQLVASATAHASGTTR